MSCRLLVVRFRNLSGVVYNQLKPIQEDVLKRYEFGGMCDISYIRFTPQLCQQLLCSPFFTLQNQCRVIAQFPEILQTLENMLILPLFCSCLDLFASFIRCCRSGVFIV